MSTEHAPHLCLKCATTAAAMLLSARRRFPARLRDELDIVFIPNVSVYCAVVRLFALLTAAARCFALRRVFFVCVDCASNSAHNCFAAAAATAIDVNAARTREQMLNASRAESTRTLHF